MSEKFDKILVVSPHVDDGELGCGGSIAKFVEEGCEVFYLALSACEKSVPDGFPADTLRKEVLEATKVLGVPSENVFVLDFNVREFPQDRQKILDALIEYREKISPALVFAPSRLDFHQDHKTTAEEVVRAFKRTTILGFEPNPVTEGHAASHEKPYKTIQIIMI